MPNLPADGLVYLLNSLHLSDLYLIKHSLEVQANV